MLNEAAKKANCHDFIMKLLQKYDTVASEAGSTLSGGKKQRISVARALLKNAHTANCLRATTHTPASGSCKAARKNGAGVGGNT